MHGDPNPFQHCNTLRESTDNQVPKNLATPLITQMDSLTIREAQEDTPTTSSLQIKDVGCGEYSISSTSNVKQLSLSPRSFGKPSNTVMKQDKGKEIIKY